LPSQFGGINHGPNTAKAKSGNRPFRAVILSIVVIPLQMLLRPPML
jgi:hypothetical protein